MNIDNKKNKPGEKSIAIKADIMDVDMKKRIVTGFFTTYNILDKECEVMMPGAFAKSYADRGPKSQAVAKIKHCLNHDLTQLPGRIITLEDREVNGIKGGYFETEMAPTTLGNDTLINYQRGVYDNHSCYFIYMDLELADREAHGNSKEAKNWSYLNDNIVNKDSLDGLQYALLIKQGALKEVTTCAFGMNELTPALGVKSEDLAASEMATINRIRKLHTTQKKIASELRNGQQSDDMMESFELQALQLEHIISNIYAQFPDARKSLIDQAQVRKPQQIIDSITENFSLE